MVYLVFHLFCSFFRDTIPITWLVYIVVSDYELINPIVFFSRVTELDPLYLVALGGQYFIAILYIVVYVLLNTSNVLGSDRTWLAFTAYHAFLQAAHNVLNCVLVERLR